MLMICSHKRSTTLPKLKWIQTIPFEFVILHGDPDLDTEVSYDPVTHIATLRCPDDYKGLPHKIRAGFRFVHSNFNPEYVFKIDDDVIVNMDALARTVLTLRFADYAGVVTCTSNRTNYCGGPLYYVSRTSLEKLQDMDPTVSDAEDICVGTCLRTCIMQSVELYTDEWKDGAIAFHDKERRMC